MGVALPLVRLRILAILLLLQANKLQRILAVLLQLQAKALQLQLQQQKWHALLEHQLTKPTGQGYHKIVEDPSRPAPATGEGIAAPATGADLPCFPQAPADLQL